MEVHLQIYLIDQSLVTAIKASLLLILILTLLIAVITLRRMKPLFAPFAFLFILALIIEVAVNGTFIRQIQS
jgi:succinate-acetate transporter protein